MACNDNFDGNACQTPSVMRQKSRLLVSLLKSTPLLSSAVAIAPPNARVGFLLPAVPSLLVGLKLAEKLWGFPLISPLLTFRLTRLGTGRPNPPGRGLLGRALCRREGLSGRDVVLRPLTIRPGRSA